MPKVSIVLPVYNGERYLRDAIDSILVQSLSDWELIVVNDCSTDHTSEILDDYSRADSRIRVINNGKNQKLPRSLNIGFSHASGEYLTWTSDDNCYLPEALETMAEYLDHSAEMMVVANMYYIDADGQVFGHAEKYSPEHIYENNSVGACFMYRHELLESVGGYDPEMFLVEDYEYWLRILFRYGKIGHIDRRLYLYRKHRESLSSTRINEVKLQLFRLREKYIHEIFNEIGQNKEGICSLYFDFLENGYDVNNMRSLFLDKVCELKDEVAFEKNEPTIIYGAGDYGNRAYQKVGKSVVCYVDLDKKKVGTLKNGMPVCQLKYLSQRKDCQILIAVDKSKVYSCIIELFALGIYSYCVYQSL